MTYAFMNKSCATLYLRISRDDLRSRLPLNMVKMKRSLNMAMPLVGKRRRWQGIISSGNCVSFTDIQCSSTSVYKQSLSRPKTDLAIVHHYVIHPSGKHVLWHSSVLHLVIAVHASIAVYCLWNALCALLSALPVCIRWWIRKYRCVLNYYYERVL